MRIMKNRIAGTLLGSALFLLASIATNIVSGLSDYVISQDLVMRVWPVYGTQVLLYAHYGRDVTYRGMLATIGTQCICHGVGVGFMMYALAGVWTL